MTQKTWTKKVGRFQAHEGGKRMMLFLGCKRKLYVNLKNKNLFVLCPGAFESLRGWVSKWNEIADVAVFPSAPASSSGLSNGL